MNDIEKALMHALFVHLHHNIDKAIDFKAIDALNKKVGKLFPGSLVVGPGDDAAAFKFPGTPGMFVGKMEPLLSPAFPGRTTRRPPGPADPCGTWWPWAPGRFS